MGCCLGSAAAPPERSRREIIIEDILNRIEPQRRGRYETEEHSGGAGRHWMQVSNEDIFASDGVLRLSLSNDPNHHSMAVALSTDALFQSRRIPFNSQMIDMFLLNILMNHLLANNSSLAEESNRGPPAAVLRRLERVLVRSSTDVERLGECGISLEGFRIGDNAVILPCSHSYKEDAILRWFQGHDTCPVCRASVD
jgi:hypothetical protein